MIWCCPRCRGELRPESNWLRCHGCDSRWETIDGIPDLRVPGASWIDFEEDLLIARELSSLDCSLPDLVRAVYARRVGWDKGRIDRRTREVLEAPAKLKSDVAGWLHPIAEREGVLLDVGCGAGMLIAAMTEQERTVIGIDVSMTWLVVAKRLIGHFGGVPVLAAALGESLPLRDGSVGGLVSLDVIEHVRDPASYLREIDRVVRTDGGIALSTPNRFSLTAEPHVFVWGVGWLPRRWQRAYVHWRSGKDYDDTVLMSSFGLRERIRANTSFRFTLLIPEVPPEALAEFRPAKRVLALLYNRLASVGPLRAIFLLIGPFFRIVGVKHGVGVESCTR